uniref:Neuropathy target esterase sws n=2 Tax=Cacopsylla melanoneura TaxID=428564 RepID=A0A8D9FGX7_9HEMI
MTNLLKSPALLMWWDSVKKFTERHVPYIAGDKKMDSEVTRLQKVKMFLANYLSLRSLMESFYVKLFLFIILVASVIYFIYRRYFYKGPVVKETVQPRPRKRDKVLQYGQRVLRKVKSVSGQLKSSGQRKRKKLMSAISSRFVKLDRKAPMLNIQEPPMEYLHEEFGAVRSRMPQDALCLLRGIRIFGNIDAPIFSKIFKHTTAINVSAGDYLFKIGELDENFFIVQSGAVNIFLATSTGANLSLRVVEPGDSVTSLLSFLEVLTDEPKEYKTIFAKATRDSVILKVPMKAFQEAFKEYPDVYKSAIQIIMTRIQRVFFIALHQHLALSSELVNTSNRKKVSTVFRPAGLGGGLDISPPPKHRSGFSNIFIDDNVKESYRKTIENDFYKYMSSTGKRHSTIYEREIKDYPSEEVLRVTLPESNDDLSVPLVESHHNLDTQYTHEDGLAGLPLEELPLSSTESVPSVKSNLSLLHARTARSDTDHSDEERKSLTDPVLISERDQEQIRSAKAEFMQELGVQDYAGLNIQVEHIPGGTCIVREENVDDNKLMYVVAGSLFVTQKSSDGSNDVHLFTAFPGDMIGGLAILTGEASVFTIQSRLPATIAWLPQEDCLTLIDSDMNVTLKIAHSVLKRMSPFVRQFDFALDWVFLEGGQAVYRQYDRSDSTYIVLTGRLRSVKTLESGKRKEEAEYSKGDLVGLIEMVTSTSRNTTVMAVRDSELAKLPEGLFNAMKLRFPSVVSRLMYILGCRVLEEQNMHQKPSAGNIPNFICDSPKTFHFSPHASSISTLAIVPINTSVPHESFSYELGHSLNVIVPTTVLTSACVEKLVGKDVITSNAYKLTNFLAQQEDRFKICVYVCDMDFSPWTQQCLRQADCILIVGRGTSEPTMGQLEQQIETSAVRVRKELVLLHTGDEIPHNTVEWLNKRKWVSAYHHIRCSKRMGMGGDMGGSNYNMDDLYNKVDMSEPSLLTDFSRLARWITGTSVGLVLGGGGARGGAHVGMLKVLLESRIPIDLIGGVSIGSLVSALWAMSRNVDEVSTAMAGWCRNMKGGYSLITDITYPAVSILSGRKFNSTIEALFKNKQIEDLWIPYFCVTTDITASGMRIHTHGSLWRYVRASMSLSWYSPPLCDPVDSHMLLDGGYVNNLPADVLKALGAKLVIAVDVGSQDETDLFDYGDFLSGWWVLLRKLSPFHDTIKVLSAAEIESRIAYVCCSRQLQEVKNSEYCKYIRPPIDKYSTFQFGAFEQIKEIGYQHGKTIFPDEAAGKLFLAEGLPNKKASSHMFTSYVDLAEKMYKKKTNNLTDTPTIQEEAQISLGTNSDDEYDEIEDENKQPSKALKKKRTRRPTPPPLPLSSQSLFSERKISRALSNPFTQDGVTLRWGKQPPDVRLKAKLGANSRAVYRTRSLSKASELKKRALAMLNEAKTSQSDVDVPCEEDSVDGTDNGSEEVLLQVKSENDLPTACTTERIGSNGTKLGDSKTRKLRGSSPEERGGPSNLPNSKRSRVQSDGKTDRLELNSTSTEGSSSILSFPLGVSSLPNLLSGVKSIDSQESDSTVGTNPGSNLNPGSNPNPGSTNILRSISPKLFSGLSNLPNLLSGAGKSDRTAADSGIESATTTNSVQNHTDGSEMDLDRTNINVELDSSHSRLDDVTRNSSVRTDSQSDMLTNSHNNCKVDATNNNVQQSHSAVKIEEGTSSNQVDGITKVEISSCNTKKS